MGHNIRYEDYKLDVDKKKVQASWDEYVQHEDWQEGASGLPMPIRWVDSIFESYDDARKYIEREDERTWYNCMAVKYKEYKRNPNSKAILDLDKRIKDQYDNIEKIKKEASIKNRTSKYIGCPACGSSLSSEHLHGEKCPLCGNDLRSPTNLNRIANANRKYNDLLTKRAEQIKKDNKPEIRWLVKIEYHT